MFSDTQEYESIKALDKFMKEKEHDIRVIMDEFGKSFEEIILFILKKGTQEIMNDIRMAWDPSNW